MDSDILMKNIDKLHTTSMGLERIKKNLNINPDDIILWCQDKINNSDAIIRKGKNWYIKSVDCIITINAHSYTLITAHKVKDK